MSYKKYLQIPAWIFAAPFFAELLLLAVAIITIPYSLTIAPPPFFPVGSVIHVKDGMSIRDVAYELENVDAIHSALAFEVISRMYGSSSIQAGTYALQYRQNIFKLVYRFEHGDTGIPAKYVLIHEGMTSWEIGERLKKVLDEDFDSELFATNSAQYEGYLFPDTYQFTPGVSPYVALATLRKTFDEKALTVIKEASTTKSVAEIITMASLIEREARDPEAMKIISGILWKRIERGMPLQVDAVFGYINKKPTYSPTFDELKIDSPYNTYTRKGLPVGPISNPGLDAIRAALHPTKTPYYFYLTGSDGTMHYARTFEEHVANRVYLR